MDLNKLLQLNSSNISGVGSVNVTTGNSTAVAATDGQLLAWIIADGATCIIGAISNLILLLTIFVHPPLRQSSSSALIAHSIVVDLYCCTISVPVGAIILYLGPGHPQAVSFCRYLPLWVYVIYPCEAWATVMLAVHRLAATVSPIFFSKLKSRSVIVGMIVLPWVATFWVVVWQVMPKAIYRMVPGAAGGCIYNIGKSSAGFISTVMGTYLPTALTGFSYTVFLLKTLIDSHQRPGNGGMRHQRRREISRVLMISFIWHCVALYPVVVVVTTFSRNYNTKPVLRLGLRWLLDSLSALNPIICCASSKLFQEGVKKVLTGRWGIIGCAGRVAPASGTQGSKNHTGTGTGRKSFPPVMMVSAV